MRIQYLGTGAYEGVPALFCRCAVCRAAREKGGREVRTRSGALIDGALKIDFPPDSYLHMLRYQLDFTGLKSLLVTHTHPDHFAVWDLLIRLERYATVEEGAEPLTVYGSARCGEMLARRLACEPRGEETGRLRFVQMRPFEKVSIEGYRVTALPAKHMADEQALIYLIERAGRRLLYAHDTNVFDDAVFDFLRDARLNLVSLDCTSILRSGGEHHMGLARCREVRARLLASGAANPDTLFVLNHFSHNGDIGHEQLTRVADGFTVAYDGLALDA